MDLSARTALAALALVTLFAAARSARAENRALEAAANNALTAAQADYANKDYDAAMERLQGALDKCGDSNCTGGVKAALMRDIGTMHYRKGEAEDAVKSFVDALKLEPELELDPRYDTPDIHGAWEDAAVIAAEPPPQGDFTFEPAPEQKVNTPFPVYVEYSGDKGVTRVVLEYMNAQAVKWNTVELHKIGDGWGGLVPCADVVRGRLRLVIVGYAGSGTKPVAKSGARGKPFLASIRASIDSAAPHLPNAKPPRACDEAVLDCPPDFPGCGGAKNEDESSEPDESENTAQQPGGRYARWWIGVAGAIDVASLPQGTDVCRLDSQAYPVNSAGYYCTNPDGSDFPLRQSAAQNGAIAPGKGGNVDGATTLAGARAYLTLDYAFSQHFLLGARLGYVFNRYPGDAASRDGKAFGSPLHLEARGTYLFGADPLSRSGALAPLAFVAAGMAEYDKHASTNTTLTTVAGARIENAWVTSGPWFVAFGGGVRFALSARAAVAAAARINLALVGSGGSALSYGPEIGLQYGF
jgi:hypothetical protein